MNLHVFLLVFLFLFMLSLTQLYHLSWPHHCPPHSHAMRNELAEELIVDQ
jgi:hypothetical protein